MRKIFLKSLILSIFLAFLSVSWAYGSKLPGENAALTMTISPPLVKLNMEPGGSWSSSVKAVNNNSSPIKVYAYVYDFIGKDNGLPEFIKERSGSDREVEKYFLSQWIKINEGPHEIPPQQSIDIPYTIALSAEAGPGGHYAAVVIGTVPQDKVEGSGISVSSMISSLIMLKVKGEIQEKGRIGRFETAKKLAQKPETTFNIEFENLGNVHMQPQGEIRIFDMYNKEAGSIPINKNTDYGNVFPGTRRNWGFIWQGTDGMIRSMGRYKAVLALSYGEEARQTDSRVIYFWVLNFKIIGIIFGSLILLIAILTAVIRLYIRRTILKTQKELGISRDDKAGPALKK